MMNNLFEDFRVTLGLELGAELANDFTDSLIKNTGGVIRRCQDVYFRFGEFWAPVMIGWAKWIESNAKYQPYIVLRDTKPLTVIETSMDWPQIWLNRSICGIQDELSGERDHEADRLIVGYIEQNNLHKPFTMVDSGCWGTIIWQLQRRMGLDLQPLFFFSHNPYISGYLNQFEWIGDEVGEALNDSLECCFPNFHQRPKRLIESNGLIEPVVESMNGLSYILGQAAMAGLSHGSKVISSEEEGLGNLVDLHKRAKSGEFTGILPHHSPTWSKGKEFIANWDAVLC